LSISYEKRDSDWYALWWCTSEGTVLEEVKLGGRRTAM